MCVMCCKAGTVTVHHVLFTDEEAIALLDLIESRPEYSFDEDIVNAYRKIAKTTGRKDRSVY